jgi:hypothetical protein
MSMRYRACGATINEEACDIWSGVTPLISIDYGDGDKLQGREWLVRHICH